MLTASEAAGHEPARFTVSQLSELGIGRSPAMLAPLFRGCGLFLLGCARWLLAYSSPVPRIPYLYSVETVALRLDGADDEASFLESSGCANHVALPYGLTDVQSSI